MTNLLLPFLMPMLLGRTIDLRTYNIGPAIYDYEKYAEKPVNQLTSSYHVLQDDSFPYSFYGLPVDVVLRIKSDYLTTRSGAMGLSGLLKDTSWKYNSVVVGVVTVYRTVDHSLKDDAELMTDWKTKVERSQTHYASSVQYGAWCTVLFKFDCDIPGDVQAVRKTLTETLGVSGLLNENANGLWNKALAALKANADIRGKYKITTSTYSTFQLPSEISSFQDYSAIVKDFSNLVQSPGQPLYMRLKSLSELDKEFDTVKKRDELVRELEKMDDMLDDVKITKENLVKWTTETAALFEDEDEERIYNLLNKINSCIRSFRVINEDVSLYKNMDTGALHLAFDQYKKGLLDTGMETYNSAYLKLREEIDASCENNFLHKIKGLLKVSDKEKIKKGKVAGGLEECQKYCVEDKRCRSIGFASHISELDMSTGRYFKEENQCWIYFRSTNTAVVHTPNGLSGDMGVYDRKCYL